MVPFPTGMCSNCVHTRTSFVCQHTVKKYEHAEEKVWAYLFPCVCCLLVCVCVCVCVSLLAFVPCLWAAVPLCWLRSHRLAQIEQWAESEPPFSLHTAALLLEQADVVGTRGGGGVVVCVWGEGRVGWQWRRTGNSWREASVLAAVVTFLQLPDHPVPKREILYSILSSEISNTPIWFCLNVISGYSVVFWEPGPLRKKGVQSIFSLLLEWTGWHCAGHEEEEGGKVLLVAEVSLGFRFGCSVIAARMLMMCTWKYIDLGEKEGNHIAMLIIGNVMWSCRTGHKISLKLKWNQALNT